MLDVRLRGSIEGVRVLISAENKVTGVGML